MAFEKLPDGILSFGDAMEINFILSRLRLLSWEERSRLCLAITKFSPTSTAFVTASIKVFEFVYVDGGRALTEYMRKALDDNTIDSYYIWPVDKGHKTICVAFYLREYLKRAGYDFEVSDLVPPHRLIRKGG